MEQLLAEILKIGDHVHYITMNQPPTRDFKIKCPCGGLSNSSTIFFSEEDYLRELNSIPDTMKVRALFLHCVHGLDEVVEVVGGCQRCGKTVRAEVHFVHH